MKQIFSIPLHITHEEAPKSIDTNATISLNVSVPAFAAPRIEPVQRTLAIFLLFSVATWTTTGSRLMVSVC